MKLREVNKVSISPKDIKVVGICCAGLYVKKCTHTFLMYKLRVTLPMTILAVSGLSDSSKAPNVGKVSIWNDSKPRKEVMPRQKNMSSKLKA